MKKWLILFTVVFILFSVENFSQVSNQLSNPLQQQRRIALVIGNGDYLNGVLSNPENDARSMMDVLQRLGFKVYKYENINQTQMKKVIDDFGARLKDNDVGLFYYAGHGIQAKGYNYLIPIGTDIKTEEQVEYDCVRADRILSLMEKSGTKVNVIILDACRNNPFERSWTRSATGRGLAFMNAPSGTIIAYATSPGNTASDGSGKNGLYTSAILESINIPNITIIQMFQNVRSIVSQKSGKQQIPWEATSLTGDFYFKTNEIMLSEIRDKYQTVSLNEANNIENTEYFIDSQDGQRYKTVKIGNQIWMAENLRATKFNDGNNIPLVAQNMEWNNLLSPGYCWYEKNIFYKNPYGALYNWFTVNIGKLCPSGWHVPSVEEWRVLVDFLGGKDVAGAKLKESGSVHWDNPNINTTNESGFSALPGGGRDYDGPFTFIRTRGFWWSSDEYDSERAWIANMDNNINIVSIYGEWYNKRNGASVRCVKD